MQKKTERKPIAARKRVVTCATEPEPLNNESSNNNNNNNNNNNINNTLMVPQLRSYRLGIIVIAQHTYVGILY